MATVCGPAEPGATVPKRTPAPLLKPLGARIRAIRTEMGLTQEALAGRVSMAPESISRLEAGKLNISVAKLGGIAEALGVSVAELLSDASAPTTTLRSGERKIVALLDGLDDNELKVVHTGLKYFLALAETKRRTRKPTSRR